MRIKKKLTWTLGYSHSPDIVPKDFIPARVPGAVQLDMRRKCGLPDYNYGTNVQQYEWMEKAFWHYRTTAYVEDTKGDIPYLVLESIEYRYDIRLNGRSVCVGEGLYTPVALNLSDYTGQTIAIEVIVYPAPVRPGTSYRRQEYSASCKPAFSYGWDWSPRLIALGLCGDAYLEYRPTAAIEEFSLTYTLAPDLSAADVTVTFATLGQSSLLRFTLYSPDGESAYSVDKQAPACRDSFTFTLKHPELWWPSGHGEQNQYTAALQSFTTTSIADSLEQRTGFRRIKLVMNAGEWERPEGLPATQRRAPITMEINGRRIFAKGSNWVPPDFFLANMAEESYREQLRLVKEAHMNMLRVWGGGYINKEAFYTLCDQLGILVWQEFPLACANYPDDEDYLSVLEQESVSIIKRLRSHPCLALWSGGNELFNEWSGLTNQSLALRLLEKNCYDLDRHTPFIATSPLYGMGHGHYVMRADGQEALQIFRSKDYTAYTEFGCAAPSPYTYLQQYIPADELETVEPGGSYELHHAVNAWRSKSDWFSKEIVEYFCGKTDTVKETAEKGVYVQGLMYQYVFEEIRKQWPTCSMALNWCFNEPWPTAAGNSLINYPAIPKPAYERVKNALRDAKASIRPEKLLWRFGEKCSIGLWILNDTPRPLASGTISAFLSWDDKEMPLLTWTYEAVPAMEKQQGPSLFFQVPVAADGRFYIRLEASQPDLSDRFPLLCRSSEEQETIDTQV